MTYFETKRLLEQIRFKRRLAERIKEEIISLRENYDMLFCPLGNATSRQTHSQDSPVERLVMRVEDKRAELEHMLQEIMDLEDKLAGAMRMLTPNEQEIIIGYYMQGKTHYQLANETYYSRETTFRIKRKAINKIARCMQDAKTQDMRKVDTL